MIRYQFRPSLVDHCQISVLVRPFFNSSDHDLNTVINKLSKFQFAKVQNDSSKIVRFKFHRGFPREHMDWGTFQTHRRQIGLLAIARLPSDPSLHLKDMEKIQHRFGNVKLQYESAIFDARCIVLCDKRPDIQPIQSVIFLEDSDDGQSHGFFEFMYDFMSSLFVILEKKRIEKGNEKLEKMKLPTAPIEQEQVITESDTRTMKRKCLGRNRKLLADQCLLSGMYQDALYHYGHSSEHLRSVSDLLWMGAALEGLCATSIIMTKVEVPLIDSKFTLKGSGNSNLSQGDLNPEEDRSRIYVPLTDDEILSKYHEVLDCYSKFQTAHIEMEAHLKLIKLLLSTKRVLEACQVIQSLLKLKLGWNDAEKVDLCKVIAAMFDQVNLKRKAAFFRRRAAKHCFNQNNASQAALKYANASLLRTTDALLLNLKTHERPLQGQQTGWASLQLKVLLDMLHVSNRLGDTMDCIRLLCYILENYLENLSEAKKFELISQLEDYSQEVEDQKTTLIHPNGMIRPLPIVRDFKPRPLANHLQPKKQKAEAKEGGPFIFSSLSFQAKKNKTKKEVIWVCGDVAEVGMTVDNPLPAEIKVKRMILITHGIHFEAFPATLALPAESGSFPFMLLGTPQAAGTLLIKGYKVDVFGIENEVMLNQPIAVQVSPSLPLITLHSPLQAAPSQYHPNPDDDDYQTLFASLSTYRGHSTFSKLTIENIGKLTINNLVIKLKKATDNSIFFAEEAAKSILPLEPGKSADVDLIIMPEDAWKGQSSIDDISSTLTVSYASEADEEYEREIAFVVDIKVMASLSIGRYDVYEISKHQSCCCLCFDVDNRASIDMKLEVTVQETKDIKPKEICPNKTETFLPAKGLKRIGVHFPRCLVDVPNLRMKERVEHAYGKAIKEAVKINWTLCDTQYNGVTHLEKFKCTAEMVNILKPRHLGMSISVDNITLNEGDDISTTVCQMTNLHIQLTNDLDFDQNDSNCLRDFNLCIAPHQGDEVDMPSSQTLFSHFGTLKKSIKKLSPGEVLDHWCGLLFLYPGEYVVDIKCKLNALSSRTLTGRARALAVINDASGFDVAGRGSDDILVITDGTVSTVKKDHTQIQRSILQKPMVNSWARRFLVHVA